MAWHVAENQVEWVRVSMAPQAAGLVIDDALRADIRRTVRRVCRVKRWERLRHWASSLLTDR